MTFLSKIRFGLMMGLLSFAAMPVWAANDPVTYAPGVSSSLAGSPEYQAQQAAAAAAADMLKVKAPDPIEKLTLTIPGAQTMWKNCYDDCRQHQECNPSLCANQCVGEVVAMAKNTQDIADLMHYNVMAAMGAQCIGKLADYVKAIRNALTSISSGDPIDAIAGALMNAIADQIMNQILNSLTNEICSVSNQILNFADSIVKNAICLPAGNMGNPFNFNLNLKDMQCNGISVNLLTGQVNGSIVNGISVPTGYNVYNAGTTTGNSNDNSYTPSPVVQPYVDSVIVPPSTQLPAVQSGGAQ